MIEEARRRLERGEVIVLGTDTVPGLHALASLEQSVSALARLKGHVERHPYLLLFSSIERALALSGPIDPEVRAMLDTSWPGPLTAVLPAGPDVPDWWLHRGTYAARVPSPAALRDFLEGLSGPLFSTSANRTGEETAHTVASASSVFPALYSLDLGIGATGVASTLVDCTTPPGRILRAGAAPWPVAS